MKLTKKVYNLEKVRIVAEHEANKARMNDLMEGNYTESDPDEWNTLSDKNYNLIKELRNLEILWDRRNWTSYDYLQMDLVINNID